MKMKIINKNIESSFTIKKSKFYCFVCFVQNKEEIKEILNNIKKKYPDASHVCYGYILDDKSFHYSDGGEPNGTAGQPIYNAILSANLNYCLVVVVRYFGGIKFGPGPLRQTFKDISLKTLKQTEIVDACFGDVVTIEVTYDKLKDFTNQFKKLINRVEYRSDYALVDLIGNKDEIVQLTKTNPHGLKLNQVIKKSS